MFDNYIIPVIIGHVVAIIFILVLMYYLLICSKDKKPSLITKSVEFAISGNTDKNKKEVV